MSHLFAVPLIVRQSVRRIRNQSREDLSLIGLVAQQGARRARLIDRLTGLAVIPNWLEHHLAAENRRRLS
jgi:hypothetical protein